MSGRCKSSCSPHCRYTTEEKVLSVSQVAGAKKELAELELEEEELERLLLLVLEVVAAEQNQGAVAAVAGGPLRYCRKAML